MTNTVIIVPVNQDTRPTSFNSAFETEAGVRVDVTINTREQGIADAATAKIAAIHGWNQVPASTSNISLLAIPFIVAFGFAILGFLAFICLILLQFVDWIPAITVQTKYGPEVLSEYEQIPYLMKWFTKGAFVALVPASIGVMICEIVDRRSKKAL